MTYTPADIAKFSTTDRLIYDLIQASGAGGGGGTTPTPCECITLQQLSNIFNQSGSIIDSAGNLTNVNSLGTWLENINQALISGIMPSITIIADAQTFIINHLTDVKALQQVTNDTLTNITNQLAPIEANIQRLRDLADRPTQVHIINCPTENIETEYPAWISKNNVEVQDVKIFEIRGAMQVIISYKDLS